MAKKPIMRPGTINTILNTAPIVIQGATRLMKLIRDRGRDDETEQQMPETMTDIKNEVARLQQRLDNNDESNIEQIKLIEELARQNELLANQLKNIVTNLNRITVLAIIAILISVTCLIILLLW